ncbi:MULTISPECIES: hypothetical protein [Amycolatopsis]|uniref:Uncharacterized protein n=1 Tax=Amycolatopsis sacchari TaxID=115433 RepID=A0A1I3ZIH8_9PSEU|nr:hypothetical protein [Amycolatopsis sacchari]SFK43386.1 hypothetical protein SAMN05421835_12121 [Amycolatopsis sacchari]
MSAWLAAVILELGRTAAAPAAAGRSTADEAKVVLRKSALRLCEAG